MDTEENKLTSEEIEDLLKEVEREHKAVQPKKEPKNKRKKIRFDIIIAIIVIIAVIGGAIAVVAHFAVNSGNSNKNVSTDNPLQDEKYPEISDVVKNYLNAYLIEDSQTRLSVLARYVDNMGDMDESDVAQNKYVKSYSNIECYTKEGPYENTYVVYAYYEMEIKNITTQAPSISTLYVIRDSSTGNVYIHNKLSTEISKYIKNITQDSDVQELFNEVNKEFNRVVESDAKLKAFFNKLEPVTTASAATSAAAGNNSATNQTAPTNAATNAVTQPAAQTKADDKK